MKQIKLLRLQLEFFKGIREGDYDLDGGVVSIYGRNASGKTTLTDAFRHLLFGTDSQGRSDFQRRPVDENGKMVDNVEIVVEGEIAVDDEIVVLKKVERQKWTKHRGNTSPTFEGNVTDYFHNGFPVSKKEYEAKVSEIISEDLFKLLTSPKAFPSMKWQDQRSTLMKMVWDISDADIIALNEELFAPIKDDVLAAGAEKAGEKAKATLKKLKADQATYPVRIDEASRSIVEVDVPALTAKKEELKKQLEAIEAQKAGLIDSTTTIRSIQADIMQAKLDAEDLKRQRSMDLQKVKSAKREELHKKQTEADDLNGKLIKAKRAYQLAKDAVDSYADELGRMATEYKTVKARELPESSLSCPTCGRPFETDRLDAIRASFETKKASDLDRIIASGKEIRKHLDEAKAGIDGLEKNVDDIADALQKVNEEYWTLSAEYNSMTTDPDVSQDPEYKEYMTKIANLEAQLASIETANETSTLSDRENALKFELEQVNAELSMVDSNKRAEERIRQLQDEQRENLQMVADQEQVVYLLEEFTKLKMETISGHVNAKFKHVRFKLFDTLINGGIKETCVMQINSNGSYVDYSNANSAAQIQGGLDVINALSELYEVSAPIWIDNRESVTEIPEVNGQVINLVVSPEDKVLRIVKEA